MQDTRTSSKWVTIKDKSLIMSILQSYGDPDKNKILAATEHPKFILDIIEACKLPQTSTYRKINSLIQNGLLIPYGTIPMKYGKNVVQYISLFKNLEINIVKNDVFIRTIIQEASKNAVLRMMREKIINSQKIDLKANKNVSKAAIQNLEKDSSKSVVPYLLKQRIIKV